MKKTILSFVTALLLFGCAPLNDDISIVPYPNHIEPRRGYLALDVSHLVWCDGRADERTLEAVTEFAGRLAHVSGNTAADGTELAGAESGAAIRFILDEEIPTEGYMLDITRKRAEVRASDFSGFFYAIQSIKQMLPAAVYASEPAPELEWRLPCVRIEDSPRFHYRGMHMDVVRHFFPLEEVKRYIDIMAVHKLNVLHWHLTDDQGWRIEIKRYPELIEKGSVRKGTMVGKQWDVSDNIPYGGHFTQDEIREVVEYAASRAITVIPEIDLPGHMLAALTAYPHLGCTGGPYDVWYRWGVAEDVLCPGKDEVFQFLEGVLTEVMELFPSEYIHIGGDECPKVRWQSCPDCQARIRELGITDDGEHSAEHYLQSYVMARIGGFLNRHGRRVIGWDELLEGEVAPSTTIMSWRGISGGVAAARLGHDVIMTPNSHLYFDYCQGLDQENEPLGIGGYVPIEKVYSFEPMPEELTPEEQKLIIGVQANLWTEYIADTDHLEYMLLPRLSALSEVQWCYEGRRDWDRFISRFRMAEIYDAMGCNYAKHIYGVSAQFTPDTEKGCVWVDLATQGSAAIYYTLDGSDPRHGGELYTGPAAVRGDCTLRAATSRQDIETPVLERAFRFSKSTARPVTLNSAPNEPYFFGAPMSFVDGLYGNRGYTSGGWVGYHEEPLDVTIDMGGEASYCEVVVQALIDKQDWVFAPVSIEVSTSADGMEFAAAARLDIPLDTAADPDDIRLYTLKFNETADRYLRVMAVPCPSIPDWHIGRGAPSFIFVGEIAVN